MFLSPSGWFAAILAALFVLWKTKAALKDFYGRVQAMKAFPWAPYHWLLGTLKYFPGPGPEGLRYFRDQVVEFPRLAVAWFGPIYHSLVLTHPETCKVIFTTPEPKNLQFGGYRCAAPWLGDGLLLAGGKKWSRNRQLLTNAFHFEILKQYVSIKNQALDVLLKKWESSAGKGVYLELCSDITLCTLDVILRCAFSYNTDCQTMGDRHPYVKAVNFLTEEIINRSMNIFLYSDFVYYLTKRGRKFRKYCDYVHSVAMEVINNRRKALEQKGNSLGKHKCLDFLDILLTVQDQDGEGLSDFDIRQEVDVFLFAGHDTTASGLCWTLYEIVHDSKHQERCRQEVDEILGDRDKDEILWEDLSKMQYLTMCIKEALRLHCPVPLIQRQTTQNHVIDGSHVPRGTVVDLQLYMLHHNSQVWPNPMEYNPDRFSPENIQKRGSFDFVPFSAGPRNCIGQNFAMNEMKIALARILRRFRLELDPDHEVDEKFAVVIRPHNGIRVKVKTR